MRNFRAEVIQRRPGCKRSLTSRRSRRATPHRGWASELWTYRSPSPLANTILTVNNTAGTTLSGGVGESNGARALGVAGTGTLTLAGPSYYSGGTLENLSGANTIGGNVLLGLPSTVQVDVNQLALTGAISGTADLTKTGGGTLILAGTNTYTGQTNINAGIMQLTNPTANNLTNSNVITPHGAPTGSAAVASGAITLSAANSYLGSTTVNGTGSGQLTLGNISALSNSTVTLTSGLVANNVGANFAVANPVNFTNSVVTLGVGNRTFFVGPIVLTGSNQILISTPTFFSGVVSGTGSLNLVSGNALVMQNPNNTYSGGTNVGTGASNGQLQVNSSDVFVGGVIVSGPLGTGPVNLMGGVLQNANSSVADYATNSIALHSAFNSINANTTIGGPGPTTAGRGGDITLAGPVTVTGNTNTLSVAASINFTIAGVVSGTGALTKGGAGSLLLDGTAANTNTGGTTTVNAGTLLIVPSTAVSMAAFPCKPRQ